MTPLIGNQARFDAVARAFDRGIVPQTLLLSGPLGVGKSTFVTRYAQLLLCPQIERDAQLPRGCGRCRVCHQIEIGTFPDFRLFRPIISATEQTVAPETLDSSVFTVDQAREFIEEGSRKPLVGPRKVMVVSQFDRANESAQNAMLKTLEEPSAGIHLVLTTENARSLRATILSRCWHLQFAPAADGEIEEWLRGEFSDASPSDLQSAVRAAHGRPGLAKRELQRLQNAAEGEISRFERASAILARIERALPVGAFGLTETALLCAKEWWEQDSEGADSKKLGAKGNRAALARFLDELMIAERARLSQDLSRGAKSAFALEEMRKTRHYILRNANANLALDVMFSRLIASENAASRARREPKPSVSR